MNGDHPGGRSFQIVKSPEEKAIEAMRMSLCKAHSLIERALPVLSAASTAERSHNDTAKALSRPKRMKDQRLYMEALQLMRELSGLK